MNKKWLTVSLLLASGFQFSIMIISSLLGEISLVFNDTSIELIQLIATLPDLVIMFCSIIVGKLLVSKSSKNLLLISLLLFIILGLGGFLKHDSVIILIIWSILLGVAVGILMPTVISIINDEYDDNKSKLLGFQNSAVSIGAVSLTLLSGFISVKSFEYSYLLFLLVIPIFFMVLFSYKESPKKILNDISFKDLNIKLVLEKGIFIMIFFSLYNGLPANISLVLNEKGFYSSFNNSLTIVFQLLGSVSSGLIYDHLYKKFNKEVDILGIILLICGTFIVTISNSLITVLIGMYISGTSISIMMASTTETIWQLEKKECSNYSTSIVLAFSDGGGFVTSLYSLLALWIFKKINYISVMTIMMFIGVILLVISLYKHVFNK